MRLELNPLEIVVSLGGGIAVAALIVLVLSHFNQGGMPVRATVVNCAAVQARSLQEGGSPTSADQLLAEQQCAEIEPGMGAASTPPGQPAQGRNPFKSRARATRTPRTHGWRKAATPAAN